MLSFLPTIQIALGFLKLNYVQEGFLLFTIVKCFEMASSERLY